MVILLSAMNLVKIAKNLENFNFLSELWKLPNQLFNISG